MQLFNKFTHELIKSVSMHNIDDTKFNKIVIKDAKL